ncbi:MAG: hypothetical protein AABM67_12065 [Acidobacteriota bacterium]
MKGFTRPKAEVLAEDVIVPDKNIISPPPNQFTHKLRQDEHYYYDDPQQGKPANRKFEKGTKVVLLRHDGGSYCRVSDGRGLYVAITYDSLTPL